MPRLALPVLAALALLLPAVAQGAIVEGRGIAGVELGDSERSVIAALGQPDRIRATPTFRLLEYRRERLSVGLDPDSRRVTEITTRSPRERTARGARVGILLAQLRDRISGERCSMEVERRVDCTIVSRRRVTAFEIVRDRVRSVTIARQARPST